mmetsp:Transcript_11504/g.23173  ORF Transcript_11504/g.23173 Transcript_11504/m.23173 type:complete len:1339 (+) Transcript_11504:3-4019(+)
MADRTTNDGASGVDESQVPSGSSGVGDKGLSTTSRTQRSTSPSRRIHATEIRTNAPKLSPRTHKEIKLTVSGPQRKRAVSKTTYHRAGNKVDVFQGDFTQREDADTVNNSSPIPLNTSSESISRNASKRVIVSPSSVSSSNSKSPPARTRTKKSSSLDHITETRQSSKFPTSKSMIATSGTRTKIMSRSSSHGPRSPVVSPLKQKSPTSKKQQHQPHHRETKTTTSSGGYAQTSKIRHSHSRTNIHARRRRTSKPGQAVHPTRRRSSHTSVSNIITRGDPVSLSMKKRIEALLSSHQSTIDPKLASALADVIRETEVRRPSLSASRGSVDPETGELLSYERLRQLFLNKWDTLIAAWRVLDRNSDGVLTREEFKWGLKQSGLGWIDEKTRELLFSKADTDSSGRVTYKEFKAGFGEWLKTEQSHQAIHPISSSDACAHCGRKEKDTSTHTAGTQTKVTGDQQARTLKKHAAELGALTARLREERRRNKAKDEKILQMRQQHDTAEAKHKALETRFEELVRECNKRTRELQKAKEELKQAEEKWTRADKTNKTATIQVVELQKQLKLAREKASSSESEASRQNRLDQQKLKNHYVAALKQADERFKKVESAKRQAQLRTSEVKKENESLREKLKIVERKNKEYQLLRQKAIEALKECEDRQKRMYKGKKERDSRVHELEEELRKANNKLQAVEAANDKLNKDLNKAKDNLRESKAESLRKAEQDQVATAKTISIVKNALKQAADKAKGLEVALEESKILNSKYLKELAQAEEESKARANAFSDLEEKLKDAQKKGSDLETCVLEQKEKQLSFEKASSELEAKHAILKQNLANQSKLNSQQALRLIELKREKMALERKLNEQKSEFESKLKSQTMLENQLRAQKAQLEQALAMERAKVKALEDNKKTYEEKAENERNRRRDEKQVFLSLIESLHQENKGFQSSIKFKSQEHDLTMKTMETKLATLLQEKENSSKLISRLTEENHRLDEHIKSLELNQTHITATTNSKHVWLEQRVKEVNLANKNLESELKKAQELQMKTYVKLEGLQTEKFNIELKLENLQHQHKDMVSKKKILEREKVLLENQLHSLRKLLHQKREKAIEDKNSSSSSSSGLSSLHGFDQNQSSSSPHERVSEEEEPLMASTSNDMEEGVLREAEDSEARWNENETAAKEKKRRARFSDDEKQLRETMTDGKQSSVDPDDHHHQMEEGGQQDHGEEDHAVQDMGSGDVECSNEEGQGQQNEDDAEQGGKTIGGTGEIPDVKEISQSTSNNKFSEVITVGGNSAIQMVSKVLRHIKGRDPMWFALAGATAASSAAVFLGALFRGRTHGTAAPTEYFIVIV